MRFNFFKPTAVTMSSNNYGAIIPQANEEESAASSASTLEAGGGAAGYSLEHERLLQPDSRASSLTGVAFANPNEPVASLKTCEDALTLPTTSFDEENEEHYSYKREDTSSSSSRSQVTGSATIASEIANLSKNLVGCGILSLSGGIAMFCDSPMGLYPANLWIIAIGAAFGYFCWLIAKVCKMTDSVTYREVWRETIGERGSVGVAASTALKAALANLAYSIILSQTASSLMESIGMRVSRITCLFVITIVAILPLCLIKNMNVLAPFSVLGSAAILLTAVAMSIRYLDGSYREGGVFFYDIDSSYQPSFGHTNRAWSKSILPFLCMIFEAFVMHYNAPRFYAELKNPTLPRFGVAVGCSFGLSTVFYTVVASVGFLTFGGNSNGLILNNYSPRDRLATASRIAIFLSTLLTYPLVFIGFRDGVLDILHIPGEKLTDEKMNVLSLTLLMVVTVAAVFITDLAFVNAVGGGTLATVITFLLPALMYRAAVRKLGKVDERGQVIFVLAITAFGTILGAIGSWEAISSLES